MNTHRYSISKALKRFATLLAFALGFAFANTVFAQQKVEKFCRIDVWWRSDHKQTLTIDYGSKQDFIRLTDTSGLNKLDVVRTFNNDVDAINYLSGLGWSFDKVVPLSQLNYVCYFKKTFETTK